MQEAEAKPDADMQQSGSSKQSHLEVSTAMFEAESIIQFNDRCIRAGLEASRCEYNYRGWHESRNADTDEAHVGIEALSLSPPQTEIGFGTKS